MDLPLCNELLIVQFEIPYNISYFRFSCQSNQAIVEKIHIEARNMCSVSFCQYNLLVMLIFYTLIVQGHVNVIFSLYMKIIRSLRGKKEKHRLQQRRLRRKKQVGMIVNSVINQEPSHKHTDQVCDKIATTFFAGLGCASILYTTFSFAVHQKLD